jgi:hypothetical protein
LEVIKFWTLRINSPLNEHGLVAFTKALPHKFSGPVFICGASFQIKESFDLSMNLGQSPKGILVGIAQLPIDSCLGNHCAQVFGNIPFISERTIGPAEHISG